MVPPNIIPDSSLAEGFSFDVTAGDIDYDTADELVITWIQNELVYMQVRPFSALFLCP
mgnify:FL=1